MQQRAADEAPGKNWLFFGNPHFTEDFLYRVEWQRYVKEGVLTRIDLAWSRDQKEKIYVQDKLREQAYKAEMPNPRIWSREAHLSHGLSKRSFLYLSCQFKQSLLCLLYTSRCV